MRGFDFARRWKELPITWGNRERSTENLYHWHSAFKNLTPQYPALAKVATAIKDFGNIGAHGNTVEHEKLLAAYELVEIELRLLFEDTDNRRDILIDKLKT